MKPTKHWTDDLTDASKARLDAYINAQCAQVDLPEKETAAIRADLVALFGYYHRQGLTLPRSITRAGSALLGDFYRPPAPDTFYPLDSAARIYPLSMTASSMAMFRVACTLTQPVVPDVLQVALLSTLKRFPLFATTLCKGLFWHYLDPTRRHFAISPEQTMPCQRIRVSGQDAVSFRVQYYGTRISLEVFHVLTDGTGALVFLKTLVREYCRLLGVDIPLCGDMLDIQATPSPTETQDDFPRTDKAPAEGFRDRPAAQIGGGRTRLQPAAVKHLILPTDALRTAAKAHGTTVTGLLSSLLFLACASTLKGPKPDSRIQIQVPANMRKFYPSDTLRNFSMYCVLSLPYRKVTSLDAILPLVEGMLRDGTTKAALDRMATMTNDLVQNPVIRYTPLPIKRAVFRGIYRLAGENTMTTTLSNVGVVREDFGGMVERFDVVLGPAGVSRVNCAMVSYRDKAVLTLTKSTLDTRFEACLCGLIRQCGIPITLEEVSL